MQKRKFLVSLKYNDNLIISYKDKKYKIYDFNDNNNLVFYPAGVKIEYCKNENLYFVRFGKLYRRCAINRVNSREYYHKKYNRPMNFLIDDEYACKIFDDYDTARLWLEMQDMDKEERPGEEVCCESAA